MQKPKKEHSKRCKSAMEYLNLQCSREHKLRNQVIDDYEEYHNFIVNRIRYRLSDAIVAAVDDAEEAWRSKI